MGLDRQWQAVPDNWPPYLKASEDGSCCEDLALLSYLFEHGVQPWHKDQPGFAEFWDQVELLRRERPGIELRGYSDGSRMWDAVDYLLSETRRTGAVSLPDWGHAAVLGAKKFPASDVDLAYTPASDVLEIARFLQDITPLDLRQFYKPDEMEHAAVYKFWADRADDGTWRSIWRCFAGIRTVQCRAARQGEAITVKAFE